MARILIIDDDVELRSSIVYFLLFMNHEVVEANDGLEGLEIMHKEQPDIILCDVMMPKLDGYGFLQQHKLSNYAHVPVLLMSAKLEQGNKLVEINLAVVGYIRKPFKLEELKQIITAALLSS